MTTHKNYHLLFLIGLLMVNISCKKLDKLTQFEINYNSSIVIPSTVGVNLPINLSTPDIESNSESKFAVNDTKKELIEEITLKKLDLTLTSPSSGDMGFLKSISVFISAGGLPEVKIAYKDSVPNDIGKTLSLETSSEDIKEHIKSDAFSLRISTVTDEVITSDHHIDILSTFFVDAKLTKK